MNEILQNILRAGGITSPDGQFRNVYPTSVTAEVGSFIQSILNETEPLRTLEVGLAYGLSALFICDALSGVCCERHIVIDPEQHREFQDIGLNTLKAAGFASRIEFYDQPSHLALPTLLENNRTIDFAFVDGNHSFDYAFIDFFLLDKLLRVGGVIVLDDANWPSVHKVCNFVLKNLPYVEFRSLTGTGGLDWRSRCVALRKILADQRDEEYYVDF